MTLTPGSGSSSPRARVPFRLKIAAVWVVLFLMLGFVGNAAGFDVEWIRDNFRYILGGLRYTMFIAVGGIVLAVVMALLGRPRPDLPQPGGVRRGRLLRLVLPRHPAHRADVPALPGAAACRPQPAASYSWLPEGFDQALVLDAATAGIIALGLNYGAYMTEIFRAGIQSVAGGQGEAADALGMTYGQKMRKVVLPQAFRVIIPPTGNEFIAMMKDTALVSFLGVTAASAEVFRRAQLVGKADFKNLEALRRRRARLLGAHRALHVLPVPARAADRPRATTGRTSREPCRPQRAGPAARRRRMPVSAATWSSASTGCTRASATSRWCAGVDLEVHRGEVVVIFGRSGSGKSTVLRCVNFIEDPTEGIDRGRRHPARAAGTGPGASASRSASSGCTSAWSSSSSTCSRT